jgi:hypothetical protein
MRCLTPNFAQLKSLVLSPCVVALSAVTGTALGGSEPIFDQQLAAYVRYPEARMGFGERLAKATRAELRSFAHAIRSLESGDPIPSHMADALMRLVELEVSAAEKNGVPSFAPDETSRPDSSVLVGSPRLLIDSWCYANQVFALHDTSKAESAKQLPSGSRKEYFGNLLKVIEGNEPGTIDGIASYRVGSDSGDQILKVATSLACTLLSLRAAQYNEARRYLHEVGPGQSHEPRPKAEISLLRLQGIDWEKAYIGILVGQLTDFARDDEECRPFLVSLIEQGGDSAIASLLDLFRASDLPDLGIGLANCLTRNHANVSGEEYPGSDPHVGVQFFGRERTTSPTLNRRIVQALLLELMTPRNVDEQAEIVAVLSAADPPGLTDGVRLVAASNMAQPVREAILEYLDKRGVKLTLPPVHRIRIRLVSNGGPLARINATIQFRNERILRVRGDIHTDADGWMEIDTGEYYEFHDLALADLTAELIGTVSVASDPVFRVRIPRLDEIQAKEKVLTVPLVNASIRLIDTRSVPEKLSKVEISLEDEGHRWQMAHAASPEGIIQLPRIMPGTYKVRIWFDIPGCANVETDLEFKPTNAKPIDIVLRRGADVYVRLGAETWGGLESITICDGKRIEPSIEDKPGQQRFIGLPCGVYRFLFGSRGLTEFEDTALQTAPTTYAPSGFVERHLVITETSPLEIDLGEIRLGPPTIR